MMINKKIIQEIGEFAYFLALLGMWDATTEDLFGGLLGGVRGGPK